MAVLLAAVGRNALASPWNIEPRLGASGEYATNPGLGEFNPKSEEHIAALFNLPLRYDGDAFKFALTPSGRISNARGYSSLASNYEHVDSSAQFVSDLQTVSVLGDWARDSSLYHAGGLVNGVGVRRDTLAAAADWLRSLTEREQIEMNFNWSKVLYAQSQNLNDLVDYRYLSAGPTFSFSLDERDTLKTLGNYGHYQSLNGVTESKSENLQLAWVRQLNELWSLSTSAGYSHSRNTEKQFFGPFFLDSSASNQNGTVYAANLSRESEQLKLSAGFTRALQPSGFAYLTRQDSILLNETYTRSERWDFVLGVAWQKVLNPILRGGETDVRYLSAQLTADWHWTAQWIVSMHATHVTQHYMVTAGSTGVSVDINRQFLRTEF